MTSCPPSLPSTDAWESQRLVLLGALSLKIMHDLSNQLTVLSILGSELQQSRASLPQHLQSASHSLNTICDSLGGSVRQFKSLIAQEVPPLHTFDAAPLLNDFLAQMASIGWLTSQSVSKSIILRCEKNIFISLLTHIASQVSLPGQIEISSGEGRQDLFRLGAPSNFCHGNFICLDISLSQPLRSDVESMDFQRGEAVRSALLEMCKLLGAHGRLLGIGVFTGFQILIPTHHSSCVLN